MVILFFLFEWLAMWHQRNAMIRNEDFFRFKKAREADDREGEQSPKGFEVWLTEGIGMQEIRLYSLPGLTERNLPEAW